MFLRSTKSESISLHALQSAAAAKHTSRVCLFVEGAIVLAGLKGKPRGTPQFWGSTPKKRHTQPNPSGGKDTKPVGPRRRQGADSLLIAKFDSLGLTRAEIALGNADPIARHLDPLDPAAASDPLSLLKAPENAELCSPRLAEQVVPARRLMHNLKHGMTELESNSILHALQNNPLP